MHVTQQHPRFPIFLYLKIKVFWDMTPCRLAVTYVSENHGATGMSSHPRTLDPRQQYVTNSRRFNFFPFLFCVLYLSSFSCLMSVCHPFQVLSHLR
jgi:hypothetical protein